MTLPFPIQFASNGPQWAQGFDAWYDYTKPQGSQLLAFPPATDTHSATVSAQSSFGGWQAIPANVPSRTDLGLQTVPTRTNSIRNNSMVGAVAGSPGTLPTNLAGTQCALQVVELGTLNGINYIDLRATRTNSSGGNEFPQIFFEGVSGGAAASVGQVWTASSWAQVLSGSAPSTSLSLREQVIGSYLANSEIAFGASFARATLTRTFNQPTVNQANASITFGLLPNGQSFDVTIRIGWPQLELGAFASAPILTTSGAATVNGNQQVVDLTGRLSAGVGGIVQFNGLSALVAGDFGRIITFTDGGADDNNAFRIYRDGATRYLAELWTGAFKQAAIPITGGAISGLQTLAFAYAENYVNARFVGQSASSADTSASLPTLTKMNIGSNGINGASGNYQLTRRLALKFGAQDATTFADLFAKATILAAVS